MTSLTPQITTPTGKRAISYVPNYAVYQRNFQPSAIDYKKQGNLVHAFLTLAETTKGSGLWVVKSSDTYADGLDQYSKVFPSPVSDQNVVLPPCTWGTVGYSLGIFRQECQPKTSERGYQIQSLLATTTGARWLIQKDQTLYQQVPVDMTANQCEVSYNKYINVQKDLFNTFNRDNTSVTYQKVCYAGSVDWVNDNDNGPYAAGMYADKTLNQVNDNGNVFDCNMISSRKLCCRDENSAAQQCAVCGLNKNCNGNADGSLQDGNFFCTWTNAPPCNLRKKLNANRFTVAQATKVQSLQANSAALSAPKLQENGVAICQSCNQSNVINATDQATVLNNLQSNKQSCIISGIQNGESATSTTPKQGDGPVVSATNPDGTSNIPQTTPTSAPTITATAGSNTDTPSTTNTPNKLIYIWGGVILVLLLTVLLLLFAQRR